MTSPVPAGAPRRGDIQGLRAVAVLLVVIFHAGLPLPGGFVGVDVFFVISGYVITRMLSRELGDTDRLNLGVFYLRRIRRILPALAVLLVATLAASTLLAPIGGQVVTARTGAAAAVFNANTYLMRYTGGYFDVQSNVNALLHTWSLSVEEQFYLVFPALLLGVWALARRTRWTSPARAVTTALVAIVVVSFAVSWAFSTGHVGGLSLDNGAAARIAFYSAPTRAWEFAFGGIIACLHRPLGRLGARTSLACALAGTAGIVWAAFAINDQSAFPGVVALAPVVGAGLLIAAGERPGTNPVNRTLAIGPAQRVGDVSYSWYLWHWPLIVFATALWPGASAALVVAAAVSIVPAWLSLRYVENPIRFRRRAPTRRTLALAGLCILMPLAAAVGLGVTHRVLVRTDSLQAFDDAFARHADSVVGCDNATPVGARADAPQCIWRVDDPVGQAVLVGDSNAGHFTEGFTAGFNAAGWTATVATMSSCPFVDLVPRPNGNEDRQCRDFVTESIPQLVAMHPDLVVLASSTDWYLDTHAFGLASARDETRFGNAVEKAAAWSRGLARVIEPLRASGIPVVVVHPVPKFGNWDPRECATIRWLRDRASCGRTLDTARMLRRRAPAVRAEDRATQETGAATVDFAPVLCPRTRCSTLAEDGWRWRDGEHITDAESARLADRFRALAEQY